MHKLLKQNVIVLSLLIVSLILPGCHRISLQSEHIHVQQLARQITQQDTNLCVDNYDVQADIKKGLSRNEAIRLALLNNKTLQAAFQELSIAKADLVQAGLLRNPSVQVAFDIPKHDSPFSTNIELESSVLSLTELWQLPLRKRAFSSQLEVVIRSFTSAVLDTMIEVERAYDSVLLKTTLLTNAHDILRTMNALKKDIYIRQNFGLTNDLDNYLIDVSQGVWQAKVISLNAQVQEAYLNLGNLLGINYNDALKLKLTDHITQELPLTHSAEELIELALREHPYIQLGCTKIQHYKDQIAYEQSRIFKQIDLGVAFKRDFDPVAKGTGPYVTGELPLYDQNQAGIARAQFNLTKAQKELTDTKLHITSAIKNAIIKIKALSESHELYKKRLINSNKQALSFAKSFHKKMLITTPNLLQTHEQLYRTQKKYLRIVYKQREALYQLERAVGRRIIQGLLH